MDFGKRSLGFLLNCREESRVCWCSRVCTCYQLSLDFYFSYMYNRNPHAAEACLAERVHDVLGTLSPQQCRVRCKARRHS